MKKAILLLLILGTFLGTTTSCRKPDKKQNTEHKEGDGHDHKEGDGHEHKDGDGHEHKEGDGHKHKEGEKH